MARFNRCVGLLGWGGCLAVSELTAILQRHAIAEVTPDAVLADLIPCCLTRVFTLVCEIDEAFDMCIPDAVSAGWQTVADIQRTVASAAMENPGQ